MIPRLRFLLLVQLLAVFVAHGGAKPNILLIVADDLGLQLSCYRDRHIRTPHLDALAASGTRFETAYITQASCSPSRVSIFTGLFPHTHGHIGLAKPNNPPLGKKFHKHTLPALLKAAGYRTGIIGKLHVHPKKAFRFDLNRNADLGPNGGREIRAMAKAAGEFLSEDSSKPFFLMMSYVDPHHPFAAQMDGLPEKPTLPGEVAAWPFHRVISDAVLKEAANYYNCVRRLDAGVGMLMEKLRAAGKDENTLIIFLGDHGPPFARAKTTCYEAGLRVPFIVRWRGVAKAGLVSDAFVSSVDILPTVLDAAGLEIPAHVQGRSLRTVAAGNNAGWRTTLAGEYHQHGERPFFPRRALRDSRYKVIHNLLAGKLEVSPRVDGDTAPQTALSKAYQGTIIRKAIERQADPPEWELYDLLADPWEFRDLSSDPAHAETLKRMQALLHDWRRETNDPYLDPTVLARKHAEVNGATGPTGRRGSPWALEALVADTHRASLRTREQVLRKTVTRNYYWPDGAWGETLWALAALRLNEKVDLANARLLKRANDYLARKRSKGETSNFDPGETGGAPWAYFALTDYVRILYLFRAESPHFPGRLRPDTEAAMKEALWLWVKTDSKVANATLRDLLLLLGTENHDLTRRPNHYLVAALLKGDPAYRDRPFDDGHTAAEHAAAYREFFRAWPRIRARTGLWFEVGSDTYQKYSWPALFNLHELAPDPVVRERFGMLLDLAFIEEAQVSVRGRRGGGRSRAGYGKHGFECYKELLYASEDRPRGASHSNVIETSRYQLPTAAILLRKAEFPAPKAFAIRNRVLGEYDSENPGAEDGSRYAADSALVNYAWRTPHYLLGSTLQNPALSWPDPDTGEPVPKYGGISTQNRWCGMLFDDPASDEVCAVYPVIEKTRGGRPQHSHWSVQHENGLLVQRIPPRNRRRMGSYSTGAVGIRFHGESLQKAEDSGWIFASNGKAFVGVRFLDGGFRWDDAREVAWPTDFKHATDGSRILLHAGALTTHGSFARFRATVLDNPLKIDPDEVDYRFGSTGNRIEATLFHPDRPERFALPRINGRPIDLRPPMTYQSPYLNGKFPSDRITVTVGPVKRVLDFSQ